MWIVLALASLTVAAIGAAPGSAGLSERPRLEPILRAPFPGGPAAPIRREPS
jgi:hypothetical protein